MKETIVTTDLVKKIKAFLNRVPSGITLKKGNLVSDMTTYCEKRTELHTLVKKIETEVARRNQEMLANDPDTSFLESISANIVEELGSSKITVSASIDRTNVEAEFTSGIYNDYLSEAAVTSTVDTMDCAIVYIKHRFKEYL